ncbi:hypothetical protein BJN42_23825 [Pseudomonas koreensis]|jgi:hypothetical protein|nr:hypothetical protein BJN42_23825 [Pseudomonas koreensis]
MQAQHRSSDPKATTSREQSALTGRHLMTIQIVGTAIFEYQVQKTIDARNRLESLANIAKAQGDLTDVEALVVANVLATHNTSTQQLRGRKHV